MKLMRLWCMIVGHNWERYTNKRICMRCKLRKFYDTSTLYKRWNLDDYRKSKEALKEMK